jgi:hypothetical protein
MRLALLVLSLASSIFGQQLLLLPCSSGMAAQQLWKYNQQASQIQLVAKCVRALK